MRKDTNLPQTDFGGPQFVTKSVWSQHDYIIQMFNKIDQNCKNIPINYQNWQIKSKAGVKMSEINKNIQN